MCTGKYIACGHVDEVKPTKRKLTKREQQVMALHGRLPELTDKQRAWMEATLEYDYDGCPEHRIDVTNVGYYWKRGRVWCQHCGHVEEHVGELMEAPALAISTGAFLYTCPHCGKKLLLEPYDYAWKGDRYNESDCTIVTTIGGYTVFRTFVATRMNRLWQPTERSVHEVFQNWVCPDGREVILSRTFWSSFYSGVKWKIDSPFCPRKKRMGFYSFGDVYEIRQNYFYPVCRVSAIARRNGWHKGIMFSYTSPVRQLQYLLTNHIAEMLVKTGQVKLFCYFTNKLFDGIEHYLPSVRICNRNRYVIQDASMWIDYIDLLEYFGKDVRNAYYVCPAHLSEEHDRLVHKKSCILQEEMKRKQMAQAKKNEGAYKKLHGAYFGICFGNDDIMVSVVSSVQEMAMEGAEMHHCVYENEYYRKKDSLILSAKDSSGNRLETIEIDLKSWSILQSRGKFNQPTDRHQDIIKLVEKNMYQLKKKAV